MQQEQKKVAVEPVAANDLPQCCGTGCAVCVLDYPELFSTGDAGTQADPEMLAMLEAIEQAQAQAGQLVTEPGGDFQ